MTLADFKVTAGLAPDAWTHEREVDGLRQIYWPGSIDHRDGWWWAIGTLDGRLLAGGWAAGSVRDRGADIFRAMTRFARPGQAVAL